MMKKLIFLATSLLLTCTWFASCSDTKTYAELVEDEKSFINEWITNNPYDIDFGHIITKDEEWVKNISKEILTDSVHPSKYIDLGQWYTIKEGDFKRLYFCIKSWGNDGVTDYNDDEQLKNAFRNKKKFQNTQNVLVRYDSLFLISSFDYDDVESNLKGDNLDPNSYMICLSWNTNYYANQYYSMYNSSNVSYQCTSGGLGFPIRFLWEGGVASIICPFSLVESSYASYYYTMYYGKITYKKPNFIPK